MIVKWLLQQPRTPNDLRINLEKIYGENNIDKDHWSLLYAYSLAASQQNHQDNSKKDSLLAFEVGAVTITEPAFWKWADQRLDATLGIRPQKNNATSVSGGITDGDLGKMSHVIAEGVSKGVKNL